jgi:hypothetical protein
MRWIGEQAPDAAHRQAVTSLPGEELLDTAVRPVPAVVAIGEQGAVEDSSQSVRRHVGTGHFVQGQLAVTSGSPHALQQLPPAHDGLCRPKVLVGVCWVVPDADSVSGTTGAAHHARRREIQ